MLLRTSFAAILAGLTTLCLTACGPAGINGPVDVPAGTTAEGATTINGPVNVGEGAKVGEAATVNGGVRLGANSTANSARTVNGGIDVGDGARITQNLEAVNGGIRIGKGADVGGSVTNINGGIRVDGAHVGNGISTFTGDIEITHGSRVEGGIHVQKPDFGSDQNRIPRVVIGAESVVQGTLKFDREVKLLVSDAAKIGPVEGATAQRFAGDDPAHIIEPAAADAAPVEEPASKPADKPAAGAAQKP
jgi:acetyltransferase-like isoleucine patch superfamily enzyme